MNSQEFLDFYNKLVIEEKQIFTDKGGEYSGEVDRFRNFKKLAKDIELSPEKILWIYLKKHLDSICTFINIGHELSSESIRGRIQDARNYLALLAGMIEEKSSIKAIVKEDFGRCVHCNGVLRKYDDSCVRCAVCGYIFDTDRCFEIDTKNMTYINKQGKSIDGDEIQDKENK